MKFQFAFRYLRIMSSRIRKFFSDVYDEAAHPENLKTQTAESVLPEEIRLMYDDVMECKICLRHYDSQQHSARTGICGHSLCESCYETMLTTGIRVQKEQIRCPFCIRYRLVNSKILAAELSAALKLCRKQREFIKKMPIQDGQTGAKKPESAEVEMTVIEVEEEIPIQEEISDEKVPEKQRKKNKKKKSDKPQQNS